MQFAHDFWNVYDAAQARLEQNSEYQQIEVEIEGTLGQFRQQDLLETLTNALQMQTLMIANEIYQMARFKADEASEKD